MKIRHCYQLTRAKLNLGDGFSQFGKRANKPNQYQLGINLVLHELAAVKSSNLVKNGQIFGKVK